MLKIVNTDLRTKIKCIFAPMRTTTRYIILIALVAIVSVTSYQAYWMANIYQSLDVALQKELNETLRASDFAEIVHRVQQMRDENFGGKMTVKGGVSDSYDHTELTTQSQRTLDDDAEQETHLEGEGFGDPVFEDALRNENDVMNIGLSMQKGIHSGLDELRSPDVQYLYDVISHRLDSLHIHTDHALLYLQNRGNQFDTLTQIGASIADPIIYSIGLDINAHTEYQLLIPRRNFIVLRQMHASFIFTLITLLVLIGAFWYAIRLIRRMRDLDEMKSDFVNNITHELKTPIAVAYAANDALLNFSDNDPATTKQYLSISLQQLNQLSGLVEQILSLSMERRNNMQLQMSDVNVNEVLDALIETHRMKSNGRAQFTTEIAAGLHLKTDRMHFYNIVSNLIDNAIKYSAGTPQITLIASMSDDQHLRLIVRDKGIGIGKEHLPFLFEKFYRVPNGNRHDVKGYGLGLFYVKSMVDKMGGTISVNSELGKGTSFTLTIR